jgi:hypothetical protein
MARPSYLGRREGGRYFMQIRLGKPSAVIYGSPVLRASLSTADFAEARRRLMDGLSWAQDLVAAPDLETVGSVLHDRLKSYVGRPPVPSERILAERCAFEIRCDITWAAPTSVAFRSRGRSPDLPAFWVDFVDQNKSLEQAIQRSPCSRLYSEWRAI